jgi:beta-1,4-N-acetylglucosaminyltransferase
MYLVSVGTTKFDGLVEAADNLPLPGGLIQIADGDYVPKNHEYLRFTDTLGELMDRADFIISHAGVGVLFESLLRNKKVICAPNLDRSDKHQIEIADELSKRGLILLLNHTGDLRNAIEHLDEFRPKAFNLPKFQAKKFCSLADISDNQVVAIMASGGGHLEEARILANTLTAYNNGLSIDFYIPENTKIETNDINNSFTVHFHPYNAKYRGFLGWIRFSLSAALTLFNSLTVKIPRRPDHVISVGTADTAILFARLGWLGAKRTVLESRARVRSVSYSVKVLRIFKSMIFKQWESSMLDAPAIGILYEK